MTANNQNLPSPEASRPPRASHGFCVERLVRLARDLKAISGHDIGVTIKKAKTMSPDELAETIRDFGRWHKNHCEAISQQVEQTIFYALEDEANTEARERGQPLPPA